MSFFARREPTFLARKHIYTKLKNRKVGLKVIKYRTVNLDRQQRELNHAPLNQRAWVLQERLLAPRVLHFGPEQLTWECKEIDCAESFPAGFPLEMAILANPRFKMLEIEGEFQRAQYIAAGNFHDIAAHR